MIRQDHRPSSGSIQDSPCRLRVAFLTPLNPPACGIADYSEELLPYLVRHHDIVVFTTDGLVPTTKSVADGFQIVGYSHLADHLSEGRFDQIVVQLGNSWHHVECYGHLLRYGGIAVLHDLNLSGIIGGKTLARGDVVGFFREMLSAEGAPATTRALARFLVTRRLPNHSDWWMNRMVLRRGTAFIVHNEYASRLVRASLREMGLATPVWKVPQGVPLMPEYEDGEAAMRRARTRLGLSDRSFVVGSFGALDECKRLSVALRAFARLQARHPDSLYLLVGQDLGGYREMVRSMGLADRVRLTGHVDPDAFYEYMAACDCCINLRYPSRGETSAALLRVMSLGKPTAITKYAQFLEYPDESCLKIDLGPQEESELSAALHEMAAKPALRAAIGENARRYIRQHHSMERAAEGYSRVIIAAPRPSLPRGARSN